MLPLALLPLAFSAFAFAQNPLPPSPDLELTCRVGAAGVSPWGEGSQSLKVACGEKVVVHREGEFSYELEYKKPLFVHLIPCEFWPTLVIRVRKGEEPYTAATFEPVAAENSQGALEPPAPLPAIACGTDKEIKAPQ